MDYIKSGYCMIIQDFKAYCVPFTTVGIECAYMTVPMYTVELPNGRKEEFSETELKRTKEEVEELCKKKNKEMENLRKDWFENALPAIKKFEAEREFYPFPKAI